MAEHGRRTSITLRAAAAACAGTAALALLPAAGGAAIVSYGSDLAPAAGVSQARPVDTAYWQTTFADARAIVSPLTGQVRSVRVKGIAVSNPIAGVFGGESDFHLQVAQPVPDGTWRVRDPGGTSGSFNLPERGADPQTVTTYSPVNLCVRQGDIVVFNTIGGWDDGSGLYPNGTPLQIFASVPGAAVSGYVAAGATGNGAVLKTTSLPDLELLMRVTVGDGADATGICPGGTAGAGGTPTTPPPPPSPPPPPPAAGARVQKATLPLRQKVTVSSRGRLKVALFCRTGPSRCKGTVRVMSRGARPVSLGFGRFDVGSTHTGRSSIPLNNAGKRRFKAAHGRLGVTIVAVTRPGGASRRSTLAVTLRRRGS